MRESLMRTMRWRWGGLLLVAVILLGGGGAEASVQPLWLGLAPTGNSPASPGAQAAEAAAEKPGAAHRSHSALARKGAEEKGKGWGGGSHGHGGSGKPERFESGHRPLPIRTYFLQPPPGGDVPVTGLLCKADGTLVTVDPSPEAGEVKFSYPASMGEGPMHGPNTLYAVQSQVVGDTLVVRTAKWCTLHHNCGWGHEHKFDTQRLTPQGCAQIPLEIVAYNLWDFNFHSRLMSGDPLIIDVFYHGRPAAGALVRVTSEKGWVREVTTNGGGRATVQMIRDLYPLSWSLFDRNQLGEVRIEARYAVAESGVVAGQEYRRVEMVTTFPWSYSQARREYTSLAHGLLLVTLTMAVAGIGVYIHRQRRCRPRREIVFDEK